MHGRIPEKRKRHPEKRMSISVRKIKKPEYPPSFSESAKRMP